MKSSLQLVFMVSSELVLLKLSTAEPSLDHANLLLLFAVMESKRLVSNAIWDSTSTPTFNPTDAESTVPFLVVEMELLIVERNAMMDNSTPETTATVDAQLLAHSCPSTPILSLPRPGLMTEPADGLINHLPGPCAPPTELEPNNHQSTSTPPGRVSENGDLLLSLFLQVTGVQAPTRSFTLDVISLLSSTTMLLTPSPTTERLIS